jgi:hypothetical protein
MMGIVPPTVKTEDAKKWGSKTGQALFEVYEDRWGIIIIDLQERRIPSSSFASLYSSALSSSSYIISGLHALC